MTKNPPAPSLQGVVASLLWLCAHPDRRLCLYHRTQMLMQMRYLAGHSGEMEPLLRSVAQQLADAIELRLREQVAECEDEYGIPLGQATGPIN